MEQALRIQSSQIEWEWWYYVILGVVIVLALSCLNAFRKSIVGAWECLACMFTCGHCCCRDTKNYNALDER